MTRIYPLIKPGLGTADESDIIDNHMSESGNAGVTSSAPDLHRMYVFLNRL